MPKKKKKLPKGTPPGMSHKSKVESPVRFCWEVFDGLKARLGDKLRRKDAIAIAISKGVAFYTARTQWQEWKEAGDPVKIAADFAKYKEEQQRERERQKRLPDHRLLGHGIRAV